MKAYGGRRSITALILTLGTGWRWVVYFKSWPLYPLERTKVPIEWEVRWAPAPIWTDLENGELLAHLWCFKPRNLQSVASSYTDNVKPSIRQVSSNYKSLIHQHKLSLPENSRKRYKRLKLHWSISGISGISGIKTLTLWLLQFVTSFYCKSNRYTNMKFSTFK
jgi:hypothetical protein